MIQMLRLRFARRFARVVGARHDDQGMALASVIIFGTVLVLLSVGLVATSVSGSNKSQNDSNWIAAGQAAYAGVEDYQSKLANDNGYSQYGDTGSTFSAKSTFTGTNNNPAFNLTVGASATWQPVDVNNPTAGYYRYQVDNSQYSTQGILRLQSTGKVGTTTRTVIANLKQSGFLDYLYFTDDEYTDPSVDSDCPAASNTNAYQWNTTISSNCSVIQFASGDVISGPVHSNDTLSICGSTFKNTVSTSAPTSKVPNGYVIPSGCSLTPTFQNTTKTNPGNPSYVPIVQMPSTVGSLVQQTRTDLSSVQNPGCLYTGPTTFTFNGDGTWTVYSPWTRNTQIQGDPATTGSNPADGSCGTPGYSAKGNTLGSPGGQTFNVVANNLVYVQNVPTTTTDPNYPDTTLYVPGSKTQKWYPNGLPQNYTCTGADGSTVGNGVGFPASGETAPSSTSYSCKNGDAFVQGGVGGDVTIAANNYVYVTGDITYDDASKDLLGLIGQNNVYVYNPVKTVAVQVKCTSSGTVSQNGSKTCTINQTQLMDRSASDRTIQAAIMSVAHSFTVENYSADGASTSYPTSPGYPKGKLTVMGSIVQKYRGAVATSAGNGVVGTGYTKNYQYDARLAYEAPPKFLSPVATTYGITSITEAKTAFTYLGAPTS